MIVLLGAAAGCGTKAVTPVSAPMTPDAKFLLDLDYYDPVYKVDAQGRIIKLRMAWRHLPPAALAEIAKLSHLHELDLYATTVDDDSLAQLKELKNLTHLGLGSTFVTDQGLEHLAKFPSLQWLWVSKERITEEGVEKLRAARPDMHVYRS